MAVVVRKGSSTAFGDAAHTHAYAHAHAHAYAHTRACICICMHAQVKHAFGDATKCVRTLREVRLLQHFSHENVRVNLQQDQHIPSCCITYMHVCMHAYLRTSDPRPPA